MIDRTNAEDIVKNLVELLPLFQAKVIKPVLQVEKHSMSPLQFHVIKVINEKKSINMTDLANEMMISKPQLTPIIDKLLLKAYLVRENAKEDRRIINISLTELGKEIYKQRTEHISKMIAERISTLPPENQKELNDAIITMINVIAQLS
ncbi:MAG: MarR family transcriptional regulator [Desulfosporosinus sp.]|nr:MarR family transcriptional regulator [Desulfosporosinus sp.]